MADEDDKVRRNLVVVSAVILVAGWLEIPFSAIVSKFVNTGELHHDPFRIWATGLAVLLYLAIRYSFSPEGERYRSALPIAVDLMCRHKALEYAQAEVDRFTKTGAESTIFEGTLTAIVNNDLKEYGAIDRPYINLQTAQAGEDPWKFLAGKSYVTKDGRTLGVPFQGANFAVNIVGRAVWRIKVKAHVHVWTYSAGSIQLLVPVMLTLSAEAFLLFKIFHTLYWAS